MHLILTVVCLSCLIGRPADPAAASSNVYGHSVILNGGFEDGLTNWTIISGAPAVLTPAAGKGAPQAGTRFNAREPLSHAIAAIYGSPQRDVARGLALRMDHGSQFSARQYRQQRR